MECGCGGSGLVDGFGRERTKSFEKGGEEGMKWRMMEGIHRSCP